MLDAIWVLSPHRRRSPRDFELDVVDRPVSLGTRADGTRRLIVPVACSRSVPSRVALCGDVSFSRKRTSRTTREWARPASSGSPSAAPHGRRMRVGTQGSGPRFRPRTREACPSATALLRGTRCVLWSATSGMGRRPAWRVGSACLACAFWRGLASAALLLGGCAAPDSNADATGDRSASPPGFGIVSGSGLPVEGGLARGLANGGAPFWQGTWHRSIGSTRPTAVALRSPRGS